MKITDEQGKTLLECAALEVNSLRCIAEDVTVYPQSRFARFEKSLGPRALKLLEQIGERLEKGAKEHGDFDPATKRDLRRETLEEQLDAIVYLAAAISEEPIEEPIERGQTWCERGTERNTPPGLVTVREVRWSGVSYQWLYLPLSGSASTKRFREVFRRVKP